MDGKQLKQLFLYALDELSSSSKYASVRKTYEMLDWAASIFSRETKMLHAKTTITTVANQQAYDLPPDFLGLYMTNHIGRFFGKFYDGSNYSFPYLTTYEKIYKSNKTDSVEYPSKFCIVDKESVESLITGSATAAGTLSAGKATLTDTTKLFTTTNRVYARDIIHDTTQGSDGVVLSVTNATQLEVGLFNVETEEAEGITNADAYVIQPAAEYSLVFDAPLETAAYTLELPYYCLPDPVYSDYGFWRFPARTCRAIAYGAASIFKLGEHEITEAAQIGGLFADEIRRLKKEVGRQKVIEGNYREVG
jgi:hypothetical protein